MEHLDRSPRGQTPAAATDGRVTLAPDRLKGHRFRLGISQEALAEHCVERRLCVSISSIKRAESGRSILYRTARHLAAAFDVPLDTLLSTSCHDNGEKGIGYPSEAATGFPYLHSTPVLPEDEPILRSVVALVLPDGLAWPARERENAEHLVAQFGGVPVETAGVEWAAAFGLPRAYGSDAARCLDCAIALASRMEPSCPGLLVGLGEWGDGELRLAAPLSNHHIVLPSHDGNVPVYVERMFSAMVPARYTLGSIKHGDQSFSFMPLLPEPGRMVRAERPSIARYAQLQQFKAILDDAQSTQCGQLVHVRGVAGIGKSRLVREFRAIADQWGFTCYEVTVVDFGVESGAGPGAQMVRSLLGLPPAGSAIDPAVLAAKTSGAKLSAAHGMLVRALLDLPQPAEQVAIFDAMDHAVRRRRTVEALQALLLRGAAKTPVVVLIEDIHWADAAFRDIFVSLLSLTRDAAITWVTTTRRDGDPLEEHVRPYCQDLALTVFELPPLRISEATALALQHDDVSAEHRCRCVERAGGNALFLTQLLLAPPERNLPGSLRHLVQAQIDRLAPLDRRALRVASAIGQHFPLALLREMLEAPDYLPEQPERAHLLKPTIEGGGIFTHDLVMHCIYDAIPPPQKRHLHARLASHYRERDTVLWARHLDRAGDDFAPAAYLCAIREQLARHEYALSIELADQCSAICSTPGDRYALAMLAAEAAARSMLNEDARAGYELACGLASTQPERLEAILGLAEVLNVLDRTDEEDALLDQALPLARLVGNDASLARLMYLKGNIRFPRGEIVAGRQFHKSALAHARAGKAHHLEALSLSGLGDSLYAEGRMGQAHEVFSNCLTICRDHGLARVEASNLFMLGTTRIYLGRTEQALSDACSSAALGRRVGNRRAEIVSRLTASWIHLSMGSFDEAQDEVEEGLQLARSMGAARFEPFLAECQARLSFLAGRHTLALTQIVDACDAMERLKLGNFIGPWLLGTLALLSDDAPMRQRALQRGAEMLSGGCVAHNRYRFHLAAAEIALLGGDAERAVSHMASLEAATGGDACEWVDHHVRMVHAYGNWLADPCDDTRADLYRLHRHSLKQGFAFAMPRLDGALRGL